MAIIKIGGYNKTTNRNQSCTTSLRVTYKNTYHTLHPYLTPSS